jgi:ABC-type amino acid transport substrate-binding protein
MFSGLFIIASFTAAVTTTLTVTQLRTRINGPADLSRVKVATVAGSTSADYLRARHIMFAAYPDIETTLQELKQGSCDAVVYDEPILRYQAYHHMTGDVYVLPVTFERQNYAFALASDSPLRELINQSLLRQMSNPSWDEVLISYLGQSPR